jgi:hypothetical protein
MAPKSTTGKNTGQAIQPGQQQVKRYSKGANAGRKGAGKGTRRTGGTQGNR